MRTRYEQSCRRVANRRFRYLKGVRRSSASSELPAAPPVWPGGAAVLPTVQRGRPQRALPRRRERPPGGLVLYWCCTGVVPTGSSARRREAKAPLTWGFVVGRTGLEPVTP